MKKKTPLPDLKATLNDYMFFNKGLSPFLIPDLLRYRKVYEQTSYRDRSSVALIRYAREGSVSELYMDELLISTYKAAHSSREREMFRHYRSVFLASVSRKIRYLRNRLFLSARGKPLHNEKELRTELRELELTREIMTNPRRFGAGAWFRGRF